MKRAAAVIGPTSSFVRWAIRYDCDFRQLDCENLPYDTFRQLRSIRELSICRLQHRVVDGYCIHGEFNRDVKTARGFPEPEIFEMFGSQQFIEDGCGRCPANTSPSADDTPAWAGCYGWFFSQSSNANWIVKFQEADGCDLADIPESRHLWFRIWQIRQWQHPQLLQLCNLLDYILPGSEDAEVVRFHHAVQTCLDHGLLLETELVPSGHSDGVNWVTQPRCSICSFEMQPGSRRCGECGASGAPLPAQKKKVLGLRPYMLLADLVGEDETRLLIEKYHSMKSGNTSNG